MIATLQANEDKHPEIYVFPDALEPAAAATEPSGTEDPLVDLFRQKLSSAG